MLLAQNGRIPPNMAVFPIKWPYKVEKWPSNRYNGRILDNNGRIHDPIQSKISTP